MILHARVTIQISAQDIFHARREGSDVQRLLFDVRSSSSPGVGAWPSTTSMRQQSAGVVAGTLETNAIRVRGGLVHRGVARVFASDRGCEGRQVNVCGRSCRLRDSLLISFAVATSKGVRNESQSDSRRPSSLRSGERTPSRYSQTSCWLPLSQGALR